MNLNKQTQSYVFRCLEKQVDPTEIIPLGRIPGLSKQVNVSYEEMFIVMKLWMLGSTFSLTHVIQGTNAFNG